MQLLEEYPGAATTLWETRIGKTLGSKQRAERKSHLFPSVWEREYSTTLWVGKSSTGRFVSLTAECVFGNLFDCGYRVQFRGEDMIDKGRLADALLELSQLASSDSAKTSEDDIELKSRFSNLAEVVAS